MAYPFHLKGQPNEDEGQGAHLTAMRFEKRTHDQTLQFAKEAENLKCSGAQNSTVKGVKGMIWSMFLPGFGIITGVTIDYMHCVLTIKTCDKTFLNNIVRFKKKKDKKL